MAGYEANTYKFGFLVAASDFDDDDQYTPVKMNSSGTVESCQITDAKLLGILQNVPKAGEAAEIVVIGVSLYKATGALATDTVLQAGKAYVIEGVPSAGLASVFVNCMPQSAG